ncbi:M12 family metallo-peptidase [Aquimarina agarilytica]|uniref:M12 family metallo-peptidase n=1 Tax=Aquimarina agarilytica TaxID=1087449 RepID=UPI000287DB96|nr:M12 family metallo-peptidase [Aquimarina agarilytica]
MKKSNFLLNFIVLFILFGKLQSFAQQSFTIGKHETQQLDITLPKVLKDQINLTTTINNKEYTLLLEKKSNRGANFSIELQKEDGSFESLSPGPINTYIGSIKELPDHIVHGIVTNGNLEATIITPSKKEYQISNTKGTYNIALNTTNNISCNDSCVAPSNTPVSTGAKSLSNETTQFFAKATSAKALAVTNGNETVKQAEIGFDIAWSAYDKRYGRDSNEVRKTIENFVNSVNAIWIRDVLVEHTIGRIVIRTNAANCPYEKAGNRKVNNKTLNQIRSIWNSGAHGNSHNLALLHVGDGGGGLAWVGTISESNRYAAIGQSKQGFLGFGRHEIGHNWGLSHNHGKQELNNNGKQFGIMWPGGIHDRATSDEAKTMINERNSSGLKDIGPYKKKNIRPYGNRDFATTTTNNSVTINVIANDYDANADKIRLDSFDSKSKNGGSIRRQGNQLIYTAGNKTGEDIFYYNVTDGKLKNWGAVYVTVRAGVNAKVDINKTTYNYDLGPLDSPVEKGWTLISNQTKGDINWSSNDVKASDRGASNGINNINRDFVFGNGNSAKATFNHKIKNGIWSVVMNMGDTDFAHDRMSVKIENKTINNNITSAKRQFTYVNADKVEVRDGQLTIEIQDNGGNDPSWVWNRLSLKRVGDLPNTNNSIPIGKVITLRKSGGNRAYIAAEASNSRLIANRTRIGQWEKFRVEAHPQGGIVLKALANNQYVQVPNKDSQAAVRPNGNGKFAWERFEWKSKGNGKVAFKSVHSGKWLQADWNDNNAIVRARGNADKGWETFEWAVTSGNKSLDNIDQINTFITPNPATPNNLITIAGNKNYDSVMVTDISGASVATYTVQNNQIDISNLSIGMYFLKIGNKTVKLIVE